MKRCSYCGKEYADDVFVCPTDLTPLQQPAHETVPAAEKSKKGWVKNLLFFFAGFAACIACEVILVWSAYNFWIKPMAQNTGAHLQSPKFFSPHPAVLSATLFGKDGKPVELEKYKGHVIVLNVWATWCPPCMAELPDLGKLAAYYAKDTDVAVICVSEEKKDMVFGNSKAIASGAPIFATDGGRLPAVYQTDFIPTTFIIDKTGTVVFQQTGSADWNDPSVIKFVDSLRADQHQSK